MTKYILVDWPEIQMFMDHPRYKECYMCESLDEDASPCSVYMVPEDLYDEVTTPPLPEEYSNFTREYSRIKRGQKVLIEDAKTNELHVVEAESSWLGDSMPCILSNGYLDGLNCWIIAVEKDSIQDKN